MRSSRKRLSAGPVPHWDSRTHPIRKARRIRVGHPHCFGEPQDGLARTRNRKERLGQPAHSIPDWGFPAGTLAAFARATALIPGTGKLLRNWMAF